MESTITRADALALLQKYNHEPFHILHALTVEGVMRWFAQETGCGDTEYWGMVGLLHDIDFEQYPDEHCLRAPELLREAGAKEIHLRISSPPFLHPCYYGTDIDSKDHLIACRHAPVEIAAILGVDSLGYLPAGELETLTENRAFCSACFTGDYPTRIPADTRKDRFERRLSDKKV